MLIFSTCQSFNGITRDPRLSFNSIDIVEVAVNELSLVAQVEVTNPNSFPMPGPNIDWELYIESTPFIRGSVLSLEPINAREIRDLGIPLIINLTDLYASFGNLLDSRETEYYVSLSVTFPVPEFENRRFELELPGNLNLPLPPKISPGEVRLLYKDFSIFELLFDVIVENPNDFPIKFPEVFWDYKVEGVSMTEGNFNEQENIPAGATSSRGIEVSVSYEDIFREVASARNVAEVSSSFSFDVGHNIGAEIDWPLALIHTPEIIFQGITRQSLGRTMVFNFFWEVNNRNNFDLELGEFLYNIDINNRNWAAGRAGNLPRIRANNRTVIPVTVSVSDPPIIAELVDILNRGAPVNYNTTGSMSFLNQIEGLSELQIPVIFLGSTRIR